MTATVFVAGGCFPATYTRIPPLSGRVLDASGRPVPGVDVIAQRPLDDGGGPPVVLTRTDSDGRFDRPEESHWILYIVPADLFPQPWQVSAGPDPRASTVRTVTAPGGMRPFGLGRAADRVEVGDLYLTGY